jgi:hypothetical protein
MVDVVKHCEKEEKGKAIFFILSINSIKCISVQQDGSELPGTRGVVDGSMFATAI